MQVIACDPTQDRDHYNAGLILMCILVFLVEMLLFLFLKTETQNIKNVGFSEIRYLM